MSAQVPMSPPPKPVTIIIWIKPDPNDLNKWLLEIDGEDI
jgi:hypothetical protein